MNFLEGIVLLFFVLVKLMEYKGVKWLFFFISFQVTVNVLKVFLQYIESDEFKEEFGDDVHL